MEMFMLFFPLYFRHPEASVIRLHVYIQAASYKHIIEAATYTV